jgi:hypothetical protein
MGRRHANRALVGMTLATVIAGCGGSSHHALAPSPSARPESHTIVFPGEPNGCVPDNSSAPAVQITMVSRQLLFAALPDGTDVRCLLGPVVTSVGQWSDDGTVTADSAGELTELTPGGQSYSFVGDGQRLILSRPKPTARTCTGRAERRRLSASTTSGTQARNRSQASKSKMLLCPPMGANWQLSELTRTTLGVLAST